MKFSQALEAADAGHRIAREGWNGKGMWVTLVKERRVGYPHFRNENLIAFAHQRHEKLGQDVIVRPYFVMKAADDSLVFGWLASQTDMVADDWNIVEDGLPVSHSIEHHPV